MDQYSTLRPLHNFTYFLKRFGKRRPVSSRGDKRKILVR